MENSSIPFLVCWWADNYRERVKILSQVTIRELHPLFFIRLQTQWKELIDLFVITEWYSRFIKGYAEKVAPKMPVVRSYSGEPWFWPPIFLQRDAYDYAELFCFKKDQTLLSDLVVLSYSSKKMSYAQKRYTVTEKDAGYRLCCVYTNYIERGRGNRELHQ